MPTRDLLHLPFPRSPQSATLPRGTVRNAGVAARSAHSRLRPLRVAAPCLVKDVNETQVQTSVPPHDSHEEAHPGTRRQ